MATSLRTTLADAKASRVPTASAETSVAGVWALGRIECRKMVTHPALWIGMAFAVLLLRGVIGAGAVDDFWESAAWVMGSVLFGLIIGTILTANVAALRPRRDHMKELYGSLPSPPEARTAGVFTGLMLGPVLISLVLTALGWWVFKHIPNIEDRYAIDGFLAVQVPLTVLALGAIAIAVGRWIPTLLGGPVIIFTQFMTPLIWAVPWFMPRSFDGLPLGGARETWHLTYFAAVITTWVALALARDRRTVWRFAIAGGALALGIYAAFHQLPPGYFDE